MGNHPAGIRERRVNDAPDAQCPQPRSAIETGGVRPQVLGTDCHNIEPKSLLRRIIVGVLTQDELCGVRHCIYDGNAPVIIVSILNVNLGTELYRILSTPQE